VFYHNEIEDGKLSRDLMTDSDFGVALCPQMLKKALKLDQVHIFGDLSVSQLLEKMDLMNELTVYN
jgi:hypothetical protein